MSSPIGALFAGGCDGIALGLTWAGCGPVVWQAEILPKRRAMLARQRPGVELFSDVRDVAIHDERCMLDEDCDCRVTAQHVDILCGGFPCQDVSDTGKKKGIAHGTRSGLWSEFARIIGEIRPGVAFVENVRGVRDRGWGIVLGDLAALGFDAEWGSFLGADVGYPWRRERVFLLACAGADGREILRSAHDNDRSDETRDIADRRDAGVVPPGPGDGATLEAWIAEHPGAEPGLRRDLARIPDRVDRVAALGDSASPVLVRHAWRVLRDRMLVA